LLVFLLRHVARLQKWSRGVPNIGLSPLRKRSLMLGQRNANGVTIKMGSGGGKLELEDNCLTPSTNL
jgi:hypothetical protein